MGARLVLEDRGKGGADVACASLAKSAGSLARLVDAALANVVERLQLFGSS